MQILHVLVPKITNRLRYTFEFVFNEQLHIEVVFHTESVDFLGAEGAKLQYGVCPHHDLPYIGSAGLLFQKGIKPQAIRVSRYDEVKIFYAIEEEASGLPFDPFSCIFFLISRYEEYLPFTPDRHGRFEPEQSFAYRNDFLHLPIVNYYIRMVEDWLRSFYPNLHLREYKFKFIATYDIDHAYAYLSKGIIRNSAGYIKSIIEWNVSDIRTRTKTLLNHIKDPYDTYQWLESLHEKFDLKPIYFFLVGDYDEYDKNVSVSIRNFQLLIKSISDKAVVGIHPSYASNDNPEKLANELKRLVTILKTDIRKSRQHFLRISFPETYENLINHDITADYTLGYASEPGFRASTCSSYYFYNLEKENKTSLKIFPFCLMDATFQFYKKLPPEQVLGIMKKMTDEVKKMNGIMVTLMHNNTFTEEGEGLIWRKMYHQLLEYALNKTPQTINSET